MTKITCKICGTQFGVLETALKATCSGCGTTYNLRRTTTRSVPAPEPAAARPAASNASPSDPSAGQPTPVEGTATQGCTRNPVTGLLLFVAPGVVVLLLALVIWGVRDRVQLENPELQALQQKQVALAAQVSESQVAVAQTAEALNGLRKKLETEGLALSRMQGEDETLVQRIAVLSQPDEVQQADVEREKKQIEEIREQNQQVLARVLEQKDPTKAVERVEKATVVILTDIGSGSGFVTAPKGTVITNYHVVEGSSKLIVKMQKRESREQVEIAQARIVAIDVENDLACLKLPPAQDDIGADGAYPCLPVRQEAVRSGEDVFAVGSPGMKNVLLDYTVTKGIISNPKRDLQGQPVIQTSCPVNPGNSGGPLCDPTGAVVGVVVAKGRFAEAVTFAIPTAQLSKFLSSTEQEPYAVPTDGGLAAWEKKHDPFAQIRREAQDKLSENLIDLPGLVTDMKLSSDGRSLFVAMEDVGTVQEIDLATRRLGPSYKVPGKLTALAVTNTHVLVMDGPNKTMHRLSRARMELVEQTKTSHPFSDLLFLGGAGEHFLALAENAPPILWGRNCWGQGLEQQLPFAGLPSFSGFDADSRMLVVTAQMTNRSVEVTMAGLPGVVHDYVNLELYRQRSAPNLQVVNTLEQKVLGQIHTARVTYEIPGDAQALPSTLLCQGNRLICGRVCMRLGSPPKAEGIFDPSPYTESEIPAFKNRRAFFQILDTIFSVSPNGRVAASGSCIYDVASRKVIKLLPLPSLVHAFSPDAKDLYFANVFYPQLYILRDWRTNAPDAEGRF